jgi:hypothetical protein
LRELLYLLTLKKSYWSSKIQSIRAKTWSIRPFRVSTQKLTLWMCWCKGVSHRILLVPLENLINSWWIHFLSIFIVQHSYDSISKYKLNKSSWKRPCSITPFLHKHWTQHDSSIEF